MTEGSDTTELCPNVRTSVLLLHGLTGMPLEMRPVAKHLTSLGCRVETPLLPGHGGDHNKLLDTGWKDWLNGAREALVEISKESDRVVVVGLSMGALLAMLLASEEHKIDSIVLLSPTIHYDGRNTNILQVLLPLVDLAPILGRWCYWTEEPPYGLRDPRLQRQIKKQIEAAQRGENTEFGLFRTYAGSLRQLMFLVKEVRKKAGAVRCPALILHSMEDSLTTIKNAKVVCDVMQANEKEVVLLSGCDHVLTLDLRKKDVADFIGKFVIKTSWQAQGGRVAILNGTANE